MPLPTNRTLVLQNPPQPGDSLYTRPRHAMIVRMSAETFEALENPQGERKVEVEFGEKSVGFYIGENYFSATQYREENPAHHELYLRLPTAAKPMAPLKMYANVVGKLMIERKLGKDVEESVRDRTMVAAQQRDARHSILLEKPPDLKEPSKVKKTKKKEAAAPRRAAVPTSSYARPPATSSAASTSKAPAPAPPPRRASPLPLPRKVSPLPSASHSTSRKQANGSSGESTWSRARLIHCLALRPRTAEQATVLCFGRDYTPANKREILSLLPSVAEQITVSRAGDSSAPPLQKWQLKLESWREVQPYDWPNLNDEETIHLARQVRNALIELNIPQTDPVWDNIRRSANDEPASSKAPAGQRAQAERNGVVVTKTTKKTKATEGTTRKKVPDIMIPAKDESSKGKARDRDYDDSSAAGTPTGTRPTARRQPGSGYKAGNHSATPPVSDLRGNSPLPPVPRKTAEARELKRERQAASSKAAAPMSPPAQLPESRFSSSTQMKKKAKDAQPSSSQRPEVKREERGRERERERERDYPTEEKPRIKVADSPAPPPLPSFKRKKPPQDANESEQSERDVPLSAIASKKRKLEGSSPVERNRGRDLSLPKKPVVREPSPLGPSRTKVKEEASPSHIPFSPPAGLPPRPQTADRPHPSVSTSSSSSSKSSKPVQSSRNPVRARRKSPIYTSSEDESEPSTAAAARPRTTAAAQSPPEEPPSKRAKVMSRKSRFQPRPMPTDSAGLRKYYNMIHKLYSELYNDQTRLRERVQIVLRRGDGSDRDDDADDDLSPEALGEFMDEFNAVTEELQKVQRAYECLKGKTETTLGELVDVC